MTANWGVVEDRDDDGNFVAYHVMPMVDLDGEAVPSAAHDLSDACPCHPSMDHGNGGWLIWHHHDADHPGSSEREALQAGVRQDTKAHLN